MPKHDFAQELSNRQKLYKDIFLKTKNALKKKLDFLKNNEERLAFLQNEVSKNILEKINNYKEGSKKYTCAKCGTCCKAACSEFSHFELQQKSSENDNFAKSFLEVFVPYENKEDAQEEFGAYFNLLKQTGLYDDCHFYYCPKVIKNEDNTYFCSDYADRPVVCRDFPNNPLVMLPEKCSFRPWKDEFEVEALFANALLELAGYFMEKYS